MLNWLYFMFMHHSSHLIFLSVPRALCRGAADLVLPAVKAKESKDQLLLCLADMENLRARSAQQMENNRKFAIQVRVLPPLHSHRTHGY